MKRYHCWRTCSHTSPCCLPRMVTLHDTRFVKCRWWNGGWTVKAVVTWRSSASMIPLSLLITIGRLNSLLTVTLKGYIIEISILHTYNVKMIYLCCRVGWSNWSREVTHCTQLPGSSSFPLFQQRSAAVYRSPVYCCWRQNLSASHHEQPQQSISRWR